jgi:hypothetical protein
MRKSTQTKKLAYMCAKCFKTDALKLAWFFGSDSVFSDCLLCNQCFKESFNQLTESKKKEWAFYDK